MHEATVYNCLSPCDAPCGGPGGPVDDPDVDFRLLAASPGAALGPRRAGPQHLRELRWERQPLRRAVAHEQQRRLRLEPLAGHGCEPPALLYGPTRAAKRIHRGDSESWESRGRWALVPGVADGGLPTDSYDCVSHRQRVERI